MAKAAKAKNFTLGDPYEAILSDLVKKGRFNTETEVVRAGIRMVADYETKMRTLRSEIDIADAEIEAGLGNEYANAQELTDKIIMKGSERLTLKD